MDEQDMKLPGILAIVYAVVIVSYSLLCYFIDVDHQNYQEQLGYCSTGNTVACQMAVRSSWSSTATQIAYIAAYKKSTGKELPPKQSVNSW